MGNQISKSSSGERDFRCKCRTHRCVDMFKDIDVQNSKGVSVDKLAKD